MHSKIHHWHRKVDQRICMNLWMRLEHAIESMFTASSVGGWMKLSLLLTRQQLIDLHSTHVHIETRRKIQGHGWVSSISRHKNKNKLYAQMDTVGSNWLHNGMRHWLRDITKKCIRTCGVVTYELRGHMIKQVCHMHSLPFLWDPDSSHGQRWGPPCSGSAPQSLLVAHWFLYTWVQ